MAVCTNKKVRPEPDFNKTFTSLTVLEKLRYKQDNCGRYPNATVSCAITIITPINPVTINAGIPPAT